MRILQSRLWIVAIILALAVSLIPTGSAPLASAGDVLMNGDFEKGFVSQPGCGMVGAGWGCFTNGGTAAYGFYDDAWSRTVYAGGHSQLIEINTKEKGGDPNRNAGIYQTVRVAPKTSYELSLKGMIRADDKGGDPWRYRVYVGFDYTGGANWQAVTDWRELSWDTYYPRTNPGAFSSYSTTVTPSGNTLTVFIRTERKWGTWYEETDFNLDSIGLFGQSQPQPVQPPSSENPPAAPSGYYPPPAQPGDTAAAPAPVAPAAPAPATGYYAPPAKPGDGGAAPSTVTPSSQPVCAGPNLMANGDFEDRFVNGVGLYWIGFNNGGRANYGIYDEQWTPVVSHGMHGQLLEINSKGLNGADANRINGILQRLSLRPGVTYEISFDAAMREAPVASGEDAYRYMVEWGYSATGTTDPAQMLRRERATLNTIYPRTNPGAHPMQRFSSKFVAPSSGATTIAIWGLKKWATLERELDVNIDNVAVRACGQPVVTPPVVVRPPRPPKPPVVVRPPKPMGCTGAGSQWYVVQRGDTLSGIAAHFGTTVQAIMAMNCIGNPNMIYAGQKLCIPDGPVAHVAPPVAMAPPPPPPPAAPSAPSTPPPASDHMYRVERGDTLSGMAQRFGVSVAALMELNHLSDPNFIYVGQRLLLP